jgi:NAD+ diphosphatase
MSKSLRVIFVDGKLAMSKTKDGYVLPSERLVPPASEVFELDSDGAEAYEAATEIKSSEVEMIDLRSSYMKLPKLHYKLAAKGAELLYWNNTVKYCSACGNVLHRVTNISKRCDCCGREYFPQMSPAVLVLVRKGDRALLVHAKNFSRPFFGLVAGFVETGETLEECVAREVKEETSLVIDDIKYVGSQSWPFPSNMMVGFTARYVSGEVAYADGELSAGEFFGIDNLPVLPTLPSLARVMIDDWVKTIKEKK